jgi:hypothetical protein
MSVKILGQTLSSHNFHYDPKSSFVQFSIQELEKEKIYSLKKIKESIGHNPIIKKKDLCANGFFFSRNVH